MIVSPKFTAYYNTLSDEDKLESMRVINMLCEEHEKMMADKHAKLLAIGTIANDLLFKALTGTGNSEEISEKMKSLKEEAERTAKYMTIERYIEIHFGL